MSSEYCRGEMPRSCSMRLIHLSRGTLKRFAMASISASTSCGVMTMPCRPQACKMISRFTVASRTALPWRLRHSAANWGCVISEPLTIAMIWSAGALATAFFGAAFLPVVVAAPSGGLASACGDPERPRQSRQAAITSIAPPISRTGPGRWLSPTLIRSPSCCQNRFIVPPSLAPADNPRKIGILANRIKASVAQGLPCPYPARDSKAFGGSGV